MKKSLSRDYLHIVKEDTLAHENLVETFEGLTQGLDWDVIYSDISFSLLTPNLFYQLNERYKEYLQTKQVSLIELRGIDFLSSSSYFINKKFKSISDNSDEIVSLVKKNRLRGFMTFPFLSKGSSNLFNKLFYIDADQDEVQKESQDLIREIELDPILEIYTEFTKMALNNLDKNINVERKA